MQEATAAPLNLQFSLEHSRRKRQEKNRLSHRPPQEERKKVVKIPAPKGSGSTGGIEEPPLDQSIDLDSFISFVSVFV